MMKKLNHDLYEKCIEKWGRKQQMLKAVEELSELQQALIKHVLGEPNNVAEEIADVEIMIEQVVQMLGIQQEVNHQKYMKIERLHKRVNSVYLEETSVFYEDEDEELIYPEISG